MISRFGERGGRIVGITGQARTRAPLELFGPIVAAVLLVGALPLGASAAEKEVISLSIDETSLDEVTSSYCGFDVIVHDRTEGTIVTKVSKSGERFFETISGVSNWTYSAASTGATVEVLNTLGSAVKVVFTSDRFRLVAVAKGINYQVETAEGVFTSEGKIVEAIEVRAERDGTLSGRVLGRVWPESMPHFYPRMCVYLGAVDSDGDFLPDDQGLRTEARYGTDPANPDSDGDSHLDGDEVGVEKDPLDPASFPGSKVKDLDEDDDLLADGHELVHYFTDSTNPDTDGDGTLDGWEVWLFGTDPADPNSHP